MPTIEWKESFSVGHKEIDAQHKKWIEIYNELHELTLSGKGHDQQLESLKKIVEYTEYHFQYEEKLMTEFGFEHLIEHSKEHTNFKRRMADLLHDVEQGELVLNTKLLKKLLSWLSEHILKEDMKYSYLFTASDR